MLLPAITWQRTFYRCINQLLIMWFGDTGYVLGAAVALIYVYIYMYIYIYIYMCVYVYVYICISEHNQNAQKDGNRQSSAIKQLFETPFLAIKMSTGFST